jgi:hypothetical protein
MFFVCTKDIKKNSMAKYLQMFRIRKITVIAFVSHLYSFV